MKKIDVEALDHHLKQQMDELEAQMQSGPADDLALFNRSRAMTVQVLRFGILEMERFGDDPIEGMRQISNVLANALINIATMVGGKEPAKPGEMSAPHIMVHVITDELDRTLHGLLKQYNKIEEGEPHESVVTSRVDIPMKDVGDA